MFKDRKQAGELLAEKLISFKNAKNVYIVGLPRGGVVTAWAVAKKLNLPLFVLVIKKIKHPLQSELALGAVGPDNTIYYNEDLIRSQILSINDLAKITVSVETEQKKAEKKFSSKNIKWGGKTIILVDDGIATGATVDCAILYLRKQKVNKIIIAVPVAAVDTISRLKSKVDKIVVLETPFDFQAVGQFYKEFEQVRDEEVKRYIETCNM